MQIKTFTHCESHASTTVIYFHCTLIDFVIDIITKTFLPQRSVLTFFKRHLNVNGNSHKNRRQETNSTGMLTQQNYRVGTNDPSIWLRDRIDSYKETIMLLM